MKNLYAYELVNGELIFRYISGGDVKWRGKPNGYDVTQVCPLSNSDDLVIIMKCQKAYDDKRKNLVRIKPNGEILWEVGDPPIGGPLSSMRISDGQFYINMTCMEKYQVIAFDFSGFFDTIDTETGEIMKSVFVK